jgi:hypothetical protein
MKTKQEIEKLAEQYLQKNKHNFDTWKEIEHVKISYIDAYTQCQEDVDWELLVKLIKRYTEEDLLHAFREGVLLPNSQIGIMEDIFKQVVQSLNKQDNEN